MRRAGYTFLVLIVIAAGGAFRAAERTVTPAAVLWSANMESAGQSEWYAPSTVADGYELGGEFDSGSGRSIPTTEEKHSGAYSLKMTLDLRTAPCGSGTRMFRWGEPSTNSELFYTVWYYFPRAYRLFDDPCGNGAWWNVLQWKSKVSETQNDPFWVLSVYNPQLAPPPPPPRLFGHLTNGPWRSTETMRSLPSPETMRFSLASSRYNPFPGPCYPHACGQRLKDIPVGPNCDGSPCWFEVTAYYKCADDATGRVRIWQRNPGETNPTMLFDVRDVQTRYPGGQCDWSVNNYGEGIDPPEPTIYIDDVGILRPPLPLAEDRRRYKVKHGHPPPPPGDESPATESGSFHVPDQSPS